jgi:hypothetical protein
MRPRYGVRVALEGMAVIPRDMAPRFASGNRRRRFHGASIQRGGIFAHDVTR